MDIPDEEVVGGVDLPEELVVEEVVCEVELCQDVCQSHHIDQHVATAVQAVAQLGRNSQQGRGLPGEDLGVGEVPQHLVHLSVLPWKPRFLVD